MLADDPLDRVLFVDLGARSFRVERRTELFDSRIGGTGVGIRLLHALCPPGADPLGPENPIILAVGALTGLFPLISKTSALFKSPLTGNLGESHCGGRSAVAIREAGYGAIVVTGKSERPVYLSIQEGKVHFRDATALWGVRASGSVGRIIREREPGAGTRSIMRIGRAGERQVAFAAVTTETYRHFGRLGLGAVFGAKNLKALVVAGKRSLPVADMGSYRRIYKEIHEAAVESSAMKKYHDLGTAGNVKGLNRLEGLPTRNLQAGTFAEVEPLTGEALAEGYLGRRLACSHCPVGCVHIAALREPYEREKYFYKTSMIGYDYELIYALGSLLGVSDPAGALRLMDAVEVWGLDAMSAGVVLAWATEAMEKGLVTEADTGGLKLAFGDWAAYLEGLSRIVEQPTPFWAALAQGADKAAILYGGADFALTFGGNEMPGYHTGAGSHLGYLVGARHSHLCNAGYSLDQSALAEGITRTPQQVADALIKEECWRQVLSSLVSCFFARGIYTPDRVSRALACAGFDLDSAALDRLGVEIYREKFAFKFREGFSFDTLRVPHRIFETKAPGGMISESDVRETIVAVKRYHEGGIGP